MKKAVTAAALIAAAALLAIACGSNGDTGSLDAETTPVEISSAEILTETSLPETSISASDTSSGSSPTETSDPEQPPTEETEPVTAETTEASSDEPIQQLDLGTISGLRVDSRQIQVDCLDGLGEEAKALVDFEWIRDISQLPISELVAEIDTYIGELFDDLQFSVATELVNYYDCVERSYGSFSEDYDVSQVHANLVLCDILSYTDEACLTFAEANEIAGG